MKKNSFSLWGILAAAAILLACPFLCATLVNRIFVSSRNLGNYSFEIDHGETGLSNQTAVSYAGRAMVLQGFRFEDWAMDSGSPTSAPDGSHDTNLYRNQNDSSRGYVVFRNRDGESPDCKVELELKGKQVRCEVWQMK
jgi:hypothetical protein